MKCVIEFWNPWEQRRQRWNMKPMSKLRARLAVFARQHFEDALQRRVVEVAP